MVGVGVHLSAQECPYALHPDDDRYRDKGWISRVLVITYVWPLKKKKSSLFVLRGREWGVEGGRIHQVLWKAHTCRLHPVVVSTAIKGWISQVLGISWRDGEGVGWRYIHLGALESP